MDDNRTDVDDSAENQVGEEKRGKSAQDYADAMNAALDIAQLVVPFIPVVGKAGAVVNVVQKATPIARKAAEVIPAVAPVVAPAANKAAAAFKEKAPDAVNAGVNKAAGAFKGFAGVIGGAKDAATEKVRDAAEERAQEKARIAARKALLDGAGIRMSVESFLENWDIQCKLDGEISDSYLPYVGCYAIITCDSPVRKEDYSKFRDIYVGKSNNMGVSIHADIIGLGNPDVYADVKYKQHVYVLLFPCAPENLDQLEHSLIVALDADQSYNKPKE